MARIEKLVEGVVEEVNANGGRENVTDFRAAFAPLVLGITHATLYGSWADCEDWRRVNVGSVLSKTGRQVSPGQQYYA